MNVADGLIKDIATTTTTQIPSPPALPGTTIVPKPQKGIRVGAKAVSAEFAISNWNSVGATTSDASISGAGIFQLARNSETKLDTVSAKTLTQSRLIESDSTGLDLLLARSGDSGVRPPVSLDSGLLSFVGGEVLSVE